MSLLKPFSNTALVKPFSLLLLLLLLSLCFGFEGDIYAPQSEAHPHTLQFDEQRQRVRCEEHRGGGQEDEGHHESCSKKEEEKDLKTSSHLSLPSSTLRFVLDKLGFTFLIGEFKVQN